MVATAYDSKKNWAKPAMRAFGGANLLFGVVGIYLQLDTVLRFVKFDQPDAAAPYAPEAFFTMTAMDFASLIALIIAGFYLMKGLHGGFLICNVVFIYEIASFVLESVISLGLTMAGGKLALLGMSIGGAGGIGSMGTAPQFLTGYPLVGLIVLNLARRRLIGDVGKK